MSRFQLGIKRKIILFLTLFCIVLLGATLTPLVLQYINTTDTMYKQNMIDTLEYVVETFVFDSGADLEKNLYAVSEKYKSYIEGIEKLRIKYGFEYIYLMVLRGDTISFILDTAFLEPDSAIEITDYEEPPPELMAVFSHGQNTFSKPYADEYGSIISYFRPVLKNGSVEVVWGIDYNTSVITQRNRLIIGSLIFSIIVALLFIIIVILVFGKFFINPLIRTKNILAEISEGDGDLTLRVEAATKDEIGDLALYFNRTMEKIQKTVSEIQKQSLILKNDGVELASNMTETAAAVNQITANIQSMKNQTVNQSASVEETSATIELVAKGIGRLNELIVDQSSNITESSSAVEQMMANINSVTHSLVKNDENIKRLSESSKEGKTQVEKIASAISEVAHDSQSLLEVSSLIQGIASQTNLLAMNAAIEAAHAGNFGKGFAVVADEVRKLAETSAAQTKNITEMLKKITASIQEITAYSQNVVNTFGLIEKEVEVVGTHETNILNAMKEQNEGSKQVLQAISALNDITQNVQQNSTEMLTGSQEVLNETKNMNTITQQISNGINEMATGAQQITTAVENVNKLAIDNKTSIEIVNTEVGKFKI